jgi:hypothetical protein
MFVSVALVVLLTTSFDTLAQTLASKVALLMKHLKSNDFADISRINGAPELIGTAVRI